MDFVLLQVFAFLRPIMFVEMPIRVLGLNLFEVAAILLSGLLILAVLTRIAVTKDVGIDSIDLIMFAFAGWCIAIFLIYMQHADIKELAKFVLPFLTYVAAKTVIRGVEQYRRVLWLLIVGFAVPVAASTALTMAGLGIDRVNFWTGIPRYLGVYSGPHNMAHNMTFLIMLTVLYLTVGRSEVGVGEISRARMGFLGLLTLAALYCLYMTGVRTALLGLAVFAVVLLWAYRRKWLFIGVAVVLIAGVAFKDNLVQYWFYEAVMAEKSQDDNIENVASGRPRIWEAVWGEFSQMPIDRKLAGVGIGNSWDKPGSDLKAIEDSHNDFLEVLIQTGYVGFLLFAALQIFVFLGILRLRGVERHVFLALFIAVAVMNFASNSYISRFGLGQMYYLVLSYLAFAGALYSSRVGVPAPEPVAVPNTGAWSNAPGRRGPVRDRTIHEGGR